MRQEILAVLKEVKDCELGGNPGFFAVENLFWDEIHAMKHLRDQKITEKRTIWYEPKHGGYEAYSLSSRCHYALDTLIGLYKRKIKCGMVTESLIKCTHEIFRVEFLETGVLIDNSPFWYDEYEFRKQLSWLIQGENEYDYKNLTKYYNPEYWIEFRSKETKLNPEEYEAMKGYTENGILTPEVLKVVREKKLVIPEILKVIEDTGDDDYLAVEKICGDEIKLFKAIESKQIRTKRCIRYFPERGHDYQLHSNSFDSESCSLIDAFLELCKRYEDCGMCGFNKKRREKYGAYDMWFCEQGIEIFGYQFSFGEWYFRSSLTELIKKEYEEIDLKQHFKLPTDCGKEDIME